MGMAKLAMKNSTEGEGDNNTFRFNWTVGTESALDSSFFWGYLVTQVPGGFLASLYPANKVFGAAIAMSSFLNLLVPGALKVDPVVDMFVQVLKGLVEVRLRVPYKSTYFVKYPLAFYTIYATSNFSFDLGCHVPSVSRYLEILGTTVGEITFSNFGILRFLRCNCYRNATFRLFESVVRLDSVILFLW